MLKKIKKLEGLQQLSKKEQQIVTGGSPVDGYTCPTGLYLIFNDVCNNGDYLHPKGHCLCCEVPWQGELIDDNIR